MVECRTLLLSGLFLALGLFVTDASRADASENPKPIVLRMRMASEIATSKKFLAQALGLRYVQLPFSNSISEDECLKRVAPINQHLQSFQYRKLSLSDQTATETLHTGIDFCYQNGILPMRLDAFTSIYPRHIYFDDSPTTSVTGLAGAKVLTLQYHISGLEQFLIDADGRVIQYTYQRLILTGRNPMTVHLISALTPDGQVISHQTHETNDVAAVTDEASFISADGKRPGASYFRHAVNSLPIQSWDFVALDIDNQVTPLVTVLGALADSGHSLVSRDDGGVAETGLLYQTDKGLASADDLQSRYRETVFRVIESNKASCESGFEMYQAQAHRYGSSDCLDEVLSKSVDRDDDEYDHAIERRLELLQLLSLMPHS